MGVRTRPAGGAAGKEVNEAVVHKTQMFFSVLAGMLLMSVLASAPLAAAGGGYAFLPKWAQYTVVAALPVMTDPFLWLGPKSFLRRSLGWVGSPRGSPPVTVVEMRCDRRPRGV